MKVIKRDGKIVDYDRAKIKIAIEKANKEVEPKERATEKQIENITKHIEDKTVIVLDPMLATGGSGSAAITMLKKRGVKKIKFLCVIAAPVGIKD